MIFQKKYSEPLFLNMVAILSSCNRAVTRTVVAM